MTTPVIVRRTNALLARWFPVDYKSYIRSERWKRKARAAKERALRQCQTCGRPEGVVKLQAHHRTYVRLGYEIPEDITELCDDCHRAVTRIRRRIYR